MAQDNARPVPRENPRESEDHASACAELIVAWSREDAAFVVDVPELPGCMAHGGTPAEAVANAQDAISLWPEAERDMGRPIPRPRGRRLMTA